MRITSAILLSLTLCLAAASAAPAPFPRRHDVPQWPSAQRLARELHAQHLIGVVSIEPRAPGYWHVVGDDLVNTESFRYERKTFLVRCTAKSREGPLDLHVYEYFDGRI